jgi:hypothetical protein
MLLRPPSGNDSLRGLGALVAAAVMICISSALDRPAVMNSR